MTLEALLLFNLRQLLKLEAEETLALLAIYRRQAKQLAAQIALEPSDTIPYARMRVLMAQLESGVKLMEEQVGKQLVIGVVKSQQLSIGHARTEVEFAERAARAVGRELVIPEGALEHNLVPLINNDALLMVQEASKLSTARWAAGEIATIQEVVQNGVLMSKHPRQIAAELDKRIGPEAKEYEITRIAQTEYWTAANVAHRASNERIDQLYPQLGLEQVWRSKLDAKVCPICRRMEGQVHEVGAIFDDPDPDQGAKRLDGSWKRKPQLYTQWVNPPAHPRCRCRLATWSRRWANIPALTSMDPRRAA